MVLPYISMNRSQTYMRPLHPELLSALPPPAPSLQAGTERPLGVPCPRHTSNSHWLFRMVMCMSPALLSNHPTPLTFQVPELVLSSVSPLRPACRLVSTIFLGLLLPATMSGRELLWLPFPELLSPAQWL